MKKIILYILMALLNVPLLTGWLYAEKWEFNHTWPGQNHNRAGIANPFPGKSRPMSKRTARMWAGATITIR